MFEFFKMRKNLTVKEEKGENTLSTNNIEQEMLWMSAFDLSSFIDSLNGVSANTFDNELKDFIHALVVSKRNELTEVLKKIKNNGN